MSAGAATRQELIVRLSRVEGQVRGISRMVEEGRYCIDILTQVSAASRALQCVALLLLDDHMRRCLLDAEQIDGAEAEDRLKEVTEAIGRLVRS